MAESPFFRPDPNWVGDVIPFEKDGMLYLYYLYDVRKDPKPGTSWHLVTTRDLVTYEDRGEVLMHGDDNAEDFNAFTGSVVTDDSGLHHLFYTAHNPRHIGPDNAPLQRVAHATSTDLLTWTKHPEDTFGAPLGYESGDWRDPYVYRTAPGERWQMILAARHRTGPERRRGVVARCTSEDLVTWEPAEPLWDPHRFVTQECPEVFRMGQWWYLVYSEFSDAFVTRYRTSRSPEGPWTAPAQDSIDGRGYYAAKSVEWDGRRFFFGWVPTKEGEADDGAYQWAGTMSALEAVQNTDGTLAFRIPPEVLDRESIPVDPGLPLPHVDALRIEAPTSYRDVVGDAVLPGRTTIRLDIEISPGTGSCGLLLHATEDGDHHYALRLEPSTGCMVLDRWPRRTTGTEQWQISGDVPHILELERPVDLSGRRHHLDIVLDQEILVAGIDEQVVLSYRLYDLPPGRVGLFAQDGTMTVHGMQVHTP